MKKHSFFSKIFASVAIASGSIWLGSYLLKLFMVYQLFEPKNLSLKNKFISIDMDVFLSVFLPAFITPFAAYVIMVICILIFLLTTKISFKENGWLFITLMIVLLTLPFEIYLMLIDYKIITMLIHNSFNSDMLLGLFVERITALNAFPLIQILSYISIFFLIIFKPLTIKKETT